MRGLRRRKPKKEKPRPTVGLDEPCRKCGQPIYFNYRGPIEGLCGRCTDRSVKTPQSRGATRTVLVEDRESRAWIWAVVLLAFLAGTVCGYLAHDLLPF